MICETCPIITETYTDINQCYCSKLGQKISNTPCEEEAIMTKLLKQHPRKWNKYERKMRYKRKLKRLAEIDIGYPAPVYPVGDFNWNTMSWENIKYYKRYYKANHAPGWNGYLKKQSSKAFRRYKGELPMKGCGYKKTFDYWRELT